MKYSIYSILAIGLLSTIVLAEEATKDELQQKTQKQLKAIEELAVEAKDRQNALESRNASKLESSFMKSMLRTMADLRYQANLIKNKLNTEEEVDKKDIAEDSADIDKSISKVIGQLKEPESRSLKDGIFKTLKVIENQIKRLEKMTTKVSKRFERERFVKFNTPPIASISRRQVADNMKQLAERMDNFHKLYKKMMSTRDLTEEEVLRFKAGMDASLSATQAIIVMAESMPNMLDTMSEYMLRGLTYMRISLGGIGNAFNGHKFSSEAAKTTRFLFRLTKDRVQIRNANKMYDNIENIFEFLSSVARWLKKKETPFEIAFTANITFLDQARRFLASVVSMMLSAFQKVGRKMWR